MKTTDAFLKAVRNEVEKEFKKHDLTKHRGKEDLYSSDELELRLSIDLTPAGLKSAHGKILRKLRNELKGEDLEDAVYSWQVEPSIDISYGTPPRLYLSIRLQHPYTFRDY